MLENPFKQSQLTFLVQMQIKYMYLEQFIETYEKFSNNIVYFEKEGSRTVESMPEDLWQIEIYFEQKPDIEEIKKEISAMAKTLNIDCPEIFISSVDDKDWVGESQKNFVPINAGKFYIHSSYYKDNIPKDKISIEMNAGRAFGTGEHETTGNCLKALSDIGSLKFDNCLDMGCGSGILAIAMSKLWRSNIVAVDIDEQAAFVTKENIEINLVDSIKVGQSDGYDSDLVKINAPYQIITSNILSSPLIAMSGDAYNNLEKNGLLILAGFVLSQEQDVLDAHLKQGFILEKRIADENWPVLVMKK